MLNETAPPVVFIELGNIQNERDKERILDPDNRQAVARWLAEGVINDFRGN
jgi:N-acetylmuramoyl-L-alanine amidase